MGSTPMQSAAVSSSRIAIHARPSRESRIRFIAHRDAAPMIRMRKYQGIALLSKSTPGQVRAADRVDAVLAARQVQALNGLPAPDLDVHVARGSG